MAEKSKSSNDNFIAKIVKDPKQVPDTILLSGYLGASSENKHTRLYFDAQLSSYVEIPDDGILHTQDQPDDPLGRSYVWIKKDAVLVHGKANTERVRAKFLEGPVVNDYMKMAAAGLGTGTTNNSIFICNETFQDFVCGTTQHGWLCTVVQLPTQQPNCPTQYRPLCPPVTPHCPTHVNSPFICPTHICEIKETGFAQQQAQPFAYTIPQCAAPATHSPACVPTSGGPVCHTIAAPCNFTHSGTVCVTHTPACFPSVNSICVTHTPACFPSVNNICVTHTPACFPSVNNICHTLTPACQHATLSPACIPQLTHNCPTFGACPSIACGGGFGGGGNPGF